MANPARRDFSLALMATYDFQLRVIRRSQGHSATHEAAYITAGRILDERTKQVHDFSRKPGVLACEIIGPADMKVESFANALELGEKRSNSVTARTIRVALPEELCDQACWKSLRRLSSWLWENFSLASLLAQHAPPTDPWSSGRNKHGHLLLATRTMDVDGHVGAKVREWDVKGTSHLIVRMLRELWARILNQALELNGFNARVDHRSLQDRGSERLARRYLSRAEYIAFKMGRLSNSRYVLENQSIDAHNHLQENITKLEGKIEYVRDQIRQRAARAIERAQRTIRAASHGIARAIGTLGVAQCTVEQYYRRECRRPATDRESVDQTFGRAPDQLPDERGGSHRRSFGRDEQPCADAGNRSADAGVRLADQPIERHASRQGESAETPTNQGEISWSSLCVQAEAVVNLPGFFHKRGWRVEPVHDTQEQRALMNRSTGQRVVVYRDFDSGRWHWLTPDDRKTGGIIEAAREFFAMDSLAALRAELQELFDYPPAPVPFPMLGWNLSPLGFRGRAHMAEAMLLSQNTIAAFADTLCEDADGNVVALHNQTESGEIDGHDGQGFVDNSDEGSVEQRGFWHSSLSHLQNATYILVAPSLRDALIAWQALDDHTLQAQSILISTTGGISEAGREKLKRLVRHVCAAQRMRGRRDEVTLVDLTATGEGRTANQSESLTSLAEMLEVGYLQFAPADGSDWARNTPKSSVSDISKLSEQDEIWQTHENKPVVAADTDVQESDQDICGSDDNRQDDGVPPHRPRHSR